MSVEQVHSFRNRMLALYIVILVSVNLVFTRLLQLPLYSPVKELPLIFSSFGDSPLAWVISVIYLYLQALGLAIATAFSFGIAGVIAATAYPLIPPEIDPVSGIQFAASMVLAGIAVFSFDDGMWIHVGLLPAKSRGIPLARTLRSFLLGPGPLRGVMNSAIFLPVVILLQYLWIRIDLGWLVYPRYQAVDLIVLASPLLGLNELVYVSTQRLDYGARLKLVTALSYLTPALLIYYLTSLELMSVIAGFIAAVLASKRFYRWSRRARRKRVIGEHGIEEVKRAVEG